MKKAMTIMMVIIGGLLASHASGQGQGANVAADKGKEGSSAAVALLSQAGELVRYARENESAVAMLAAVQMIERVPVQPGTGRLQAKQTEAKDKGQAVPERPKGQVAAPTLDVSKLLAEARAWARADVQTLALIDRTAKAKPGTGSTMLGAKGGPISHFDRVSARTSDYYEITFRGGELARVAVLGDGDNDLDLYVYDEYKNEIVKDVDLTDKCFVEWTPKWTGVYRIRVVNLGYVYSDYLLISN